jgi:hypothetical protein
VVDVRRQVLHRALGEHELDAAPRAAVALDPPPAVKTTRKTAAAAVPDGRAASPGLVGRHSRMPAITRIHDVEQQEAASRTGIS